MEDITSLHHERCRQERKKRKESPSADYMPDEVFEESLRSFRMYEVASIQDIKNNYSMLMEKSPIQSPFTKSWMSKNANNLQNTTKYQTFNEMFDEYGYDLVDLVGEAEPSSEINSNFAVIYGVHLKDIKATHNNPLFKSYHMTAYDSKDYIDGITVHTNLEHHLFTALLCDVDDVQKALNTASDATFTLGFTVLDPDYIPESKRKFLHKIKMGNPTYLDVVNYLQSKRGPTLLVHTILPDDERGRKNFIQIPFVKI